MSSFFTAPASQRKRKREDTLTAPASKKRTTTKSLNQKPRSSRPKRDESISSSGSEDGAKRRAVDQQSALSSDESYDEDETAADRRLRLAEQYLSSIKESVPTIGFDAEQIDRDLIAERLQEDVAESKGRIYKHITSSLSFPTAVKTHFRSETLSNCTAIATCPPYVYTATKDMRITKWELLPPPASNPKKHPKKPPKPTRRRPIHLLSIKHPSTLPTADNQHHTGPILSLAASSDGKYLATGSADKRLIIYSTTTLTPLKVFTQHRDAITALSFRRGSNQLYSASKDRTVKVWSIDDMAYVETLFGHQDAVVGVAALGLERCFSVGARDRTARLWKVVEETQLVFRGSGAGSSKHHKPALHARKLAPEEMVYSEGSIDCLALIDNELFVTGSDNGSLSLWSIHKKKPVNTLPLAHGLCPALKASEISSEKHPDQAGVFIPPQQPRWITALATLPFSDVVVSGSWDGEVRVWRVSGDKRRLERVGVLGREGSTMGREEVEPSFRGVVNGLEVFERGERGRETLTVVAGMGAQHRLGNWSTFGKGGACVWEVPRVLEGAGIGGAGENKGEGFGEEDIVQTDNAAEEPEPGDAVRDAEVGKAKAGGDEGAMVGEHAVVQGDVEHKAAGAKRLGENEVDVVGEGADAQKDKAAEDTAPAATVRNVEEGKAEAAGSGGAGKNKGKGVGKEAVIQTHKPAEGTQPGTAVGDVVIGNREAIRVGQGEQKGME